MKGPKLSDGYSMVHVQCRAGHRSREVGAYISTNTMSEAERLDEQRRRLIDRIAYVQEDLTDTGLSRDQRDSKLDAVRLMSQELRLLHPGANEMFVTLRDCHITARLIMGEYNPNMEERIIFNDTAGVITQRLDGSKDQYQSGASAAKAAIRFLKLSLPSFLTLYRVTEDADATIIDQLGALAGSWDYKRARAVYALIQAAFSISLKTIAGGEREPCGSPQDGPWAGPVPRYGARPPACRRCPHGRRWRREFSPVEAGPP